MSIYKSIYICFYFKKQTVCSSRLSIYIQNTSTFIHNKVQKHSHQTLNEKKMIHKAIELEKYPYSATDII